MTKSPNVYLGFRQWLDEKSENVSAYLSTATELQIMCFTGTSLFTNNEISGTDDSLYKRFQEVIRKNQKLNLEIILTDPVSSAGIEACKYRICPSKLWLSKNELEVICHEQLCALCNEREKIHIKLTKEFIPYALFIVKYDNPDMDYIKVDLYSPLLTDSKERPCMYVFRSATPDLFVHFQNVFRRIWGNDDANYIMRKESDE